MRLATALPLESWLTYGLVAYLLLVVVWTVQRAHWVEELPPLGAVTMAGALAGLFAARMRIPGAALHLFFSLVGLLLSLWLLVPLAPGLNAQEQQVGLIARLIQWSRAAASGGISGDAIPFALLLVFLSWVIGYWVAWFIFHRARLWLALGPPTVGILVNLSYLWGTATLAFAFYMVGVVLLVARVNTLGREEFWKESGTTVGEGASASAVGVALLGTAAVVAVAWLLPLFGEQPPFSTAWKTATTPWTEVEGEFGRVFSSIGSSKPIALHTFEEALPFRGSISLTQNPVMTVHSDAETYWRGRTYDIYTGAGWISSPLVSRPLAEPSRGFRERYRGQRVVAVEVTPVRATQVVFVPGDPLVASREVRAERAEDLTYTLDIAGADAAPASLPEDLRAAALAIAAAQIDRALTRDELAGLLPEDVVVRGTVPATGRTATIDLARAEPPAGTVMALRFSGRVLNPETYLVHGAISNAVGEDLREVTAPYPGWVLDRYAALPDDLPQRVRDLAVSLTARHGNAYDKAVAIQDHLRTIRYTFDIPSPPFGADAVDYFLFEGQAGYCDYYASALAVMLRSLGIPARVSVGYFTGTYEEHIDAYTVTEEDAHTWPEVYFPTYGWIVFEPTPARPVQTRGGLPDTTLQGLAGGAEGAFDDLFLDELLLLELLGAEEQPPDGSASDLAGVSSPWRWGGPLLGLVVALVAVWILWRRSLTSLGYEARIYEQFVRLGAASGLKLRPHETPEEYGRTVGAALPSHAADVRRVVRGYTEATFGPTSSVDDFRRQGLRAAWRRLGRRLLLRALLRR